MNDRSLTDIHLLLVDADADFRRAAADHCRRLGAIVDEADDKETLLEASARCAHEVVVLANKLPGASGTELLDQLKTAEPDTSFIVTSEQTSAETAVETMKHGAIDFLIKPIELSDLTKAISRTAGGPNLSKENQQLRSLVNRTKRPALMIGDSAAMQGVFRLIDRAGPTDKPILIQGESGTGKELVAQALHQVSRHAHKPMVVINCAALPEQLLESELFGHEKGAFTGATAAKPGLFEIADGGTLFIDEIGELAGPLQVKLLRVLEDGLLRRVGSTKERRIRVRLITATNRELGADVEAGRFREDLYYRIDVMTLKLPPLRDRDGDIRLLAAHYAGEDWQFDEDALHAIEHYSWPGNVRQLINAIERAKILADDDRIHLTNLPDVVACCIEPHASHKTDCVETLAELQKAHIQQVLEERHGNKVRAARALGVSRRTLYRLIEKFGLDSSYDEKD